MKSMTSLWLIMIDMTYWDISDGKDIKAWQDCWVALGLQLSSVLIESDIAKQVQ